MGEREPWPVSDIPVWGAVSVAITLLVLVRLLPYGSVFRSPTIALLGNDPYAYLHVVRQAAASGPVIETGSGSYGLGEPLLVWVLATVTQIVGGPSTANLVLAVYPVVTAVVTGILVFVLATTVTDDIRVGLTAIVVLAVTPLHVSRTALGFADHHAFDGLFVALIATVFTWLLVRADAGTRYRWGAGGVLGIGIAAQTMAWRASPLLLLPVFISFVLCSLFLVRAGKSGERLRMIVFGFGVGAAGSGLLYHGQGWLTDFVATVPVLLFIGGVVILGLVYSVQWSGGSWQLLVLAEVAIAGIGTALLWIAAPEYVSAILDRTGEFISFIGYHQTTDIGETAPLTGEFGPLLGFTIMLGFAPLLGFPALVWGLGQVWRRDRIGLLVPIVYALWFLGLAFVQRRFAVHLAPFISILAGIGFIGFIHWLQLIDVPLPVTGGSARSEVDTLRPIERERLAVLGAMGSVGVGFGGIVSAQILSRLEIDEPAYDAAIWIREHAANRDLVYPENYVFAHWGRVRMYNHFVNGNSRSYAYARTNYDTFLRSPDPDEWYGEFSGRVGFIVTRTLGDVSATITQGLLHDRYGSGSRFVEGVRHYRALWESRTGDVKVFAVVPGAEIRGQSSPDTEIHVRTSVSFPRGGNVRYERYVEVGSDGQFSVGVPYPGTYDIGGTSLEVPESAVHNGETLEIEVPPR